MTKKPYAREHNKQPKGADTNVKTKATGPHAHSHLYLQRGTSSNSISRNPRNITQANSRKATHIYLRKLKETKPLLTLTKEGATIECARLKNKGSFTTVNTGTVEVDFEGCKTPKGGASCNSKGDTTKGVILLVNSPIKLVDFKDETVLELGGIITVAPSLLIVECGAALIVEVRGSVLGKVDKVPNLVKTKVAELLLHQTKGEQELTKCELPIATCGGKEFKLEGSVKGFELAGEETEDLLTFGEEVEVHF